VWLILTLVKEHTLIVLSVFSLLVFLSGKLLMAKSLKSVLGVMLSLVLILFSIRNYPYLNENMTQGAISYLRAPIMSVEKLGLSYILFRFIHFLVEAYRKTLHRPDFLTFVNYIFFFPTILAGPIDTYNNFQYWLKRKRSSYNYSLFFAGVTRIFLGAVKTLGIVPLIISYATDYRELLPDYSPLIALSLSLLAYSAYIYIDFSGYSDIAIGTAYLIGIKTPENFNNPYISANLSEFWKRWHITFSNFLRVYVFKPSIEVYNSIINPRHRLLVTILCYLTTFTICGLWHGDTVNFVYWGLWHGLGLAINKVWMVKVKPQLAFSHSGAYRYLSVGVTFIYVTIGWCFFHYSQAELIEIYNLLV
jgi:alginate O-acetyltransferase complex protein AlgI